MPITTKSPLLAFREAHHLSQDQAAQQAGITQSMWSCLETGRAYASPRVAKRISDLTGIGLERLLNFGDDDPGADPEVPTQELTETLSKNPESKNK